MNIRVVGAIVLIGCGLVGTAAAGTVAENKALVARFIEAGNAKDFANLPAFVTADFTRHSQAAAGVTIASRDEFALHMRDDVATFPDSRLEVRQVVAEGDRVAVWGSYRGTFQGTGAADDIVGRKVDIEFAGIFRVQADKIAELWVTWDNQALQKQLTFRGIK